MAIIKNITKREYKGKVYDLTVEESRSYNIEGLAVHNSGAGSLILYSLGVTGVDPIKRRLSMNRFLYAEAKYRIKTEDFMKIEDEEKKMNGEPCACGNCVDAGETKCITLPK